MIYDKDAALEKARGLIIGRYGSNGGKPNGPFVARIAASLLEAQAEVYDVVGQDGDNCEEIAASLRAMAEELRGGE